MYYHRYLSLFVLEDFPGVVRDTERNLRVLDLCGKYATRRTGPPGPRTVPPVHHHDERAGTRSLHFKDRQYAEALQTVEDGLAAIRELLRPLRTGGGVRPVERGAGAEAVRPQHPPPAPGQPLQRLQRKLDRAVKNEQYEEAARLRDKLRDMQNSAARG